MSDHENLLVPQQVPSEGNLPLLHYTIAENPAWSPGTLQQKPWPLASTPVDPTTFVSREIGQGQLQYNAAMASPSMESIPPGFTAVRNPSQFRSYICPDIFGFDMLRNMSNGIAEDSFHDSTKEIDLSGNNGTGFSCDYRQAARYSSF